MKLHPNELWICYDSRNDLHKKTKAFAQTICCHISETDLSKEKLTKTRWRELLEMLNLPPKKLMNKAKPEYQEKFAGHDYDDDAWLEILGKHTDLIRAPIAVRNHKAVLCERPKDVFKVA
jgi:arsenate reductase (glutaredoxin)